MGVLWEGPCPNCTYQFHCNIVLFWFSNLHNEIDEALRQAFQQDSIHTEYALSETQKIELGKVDEWL